METTRKIIRRSIHFFLRNYQFFTCTAALLAFPSSAATIFSEVAFPSANLLSIIHDRLQSLFDAAGFPSSLQLFSLLNHKLSQSISSSISTFPFTLSFFLLAKASIIQAFHDHKLDYSSSFSFLSFYNPILITHLCNSFFILSANAAAFTLLFLAFNSIDAIGLSSPGFLLFMSAAGAVIYSVILANALIICNLALAVAGMENCGGYPAILKACVLVRGRTSSALSLAFLVNFGLAAIEALFEYRVVRAYHISENFGTSMGLEGLFIAYLYSILIVLDTIVTCFLYKSCKSNYQMNREDRYYYYQLQLAGEEDSSSASPKILQEYP